MEILQQMASIASNAVGVDLKADQLSVLQMSLRAFVIFLIAIAMIRVGNERFMGKHTTLDVMLGIVFGSVVSRAITGTAPFFPTLAASVVLVAMHWTLSAIAFRSRSIGRMFKGTSRQLVENGTIDWKTMRKTHISENDLKEAIRQHGHRDDIADIEAAYLERNGSISVIIKGDDKKKEASNRPPQ